MKTIRQIKWAGSVFHFEKPGPMDPLRQSENKFIFLNKIGRLSTEDLINSLAELGPDNNREG